MAHFIDILMLIFKISIISLIGIGFISFTLNKCLNKYHRVKDWLFAVLLLGGSIAVISIAATIVLCTVNYIKSIL